MSSLAVLFLAGTARAERPTGVIPSLNATVTSLRFFESPQGVVVPRNQRVYASRFSRSQVRRIFFELNLTHPAPVAASPSRSSRSGILPGMAGGRCVER